MVRLNRKKRTLPEVTVDMKTIKVRNKILNEVSEVTVLETHKDYYLCWDGTFCINAPFDGNEMYEIVT